jgi:hypothetical protein
MIDENIGYLKGSILYYRPLLYFIPDGCNEMVEPVCIRAVRGKCMQFYSKIFGGWRSAFIFQRHDGVFMTDIGDISIRPWPSFDPPNQIYYRHRLEARRKLQCVDYSKLLDQDLRRIIWVYRKKITLQNGDLWERKV